MSDSLIPNISRRTRSSGIKPKKKRSRKALLGVIHRDGVMPIYAWVENDLLHFHKLHARENPAPIPLSDIWKRAAGNLL